MCYLPRYLIATAVRLHADGKIAAPVVLAKHRGPERSLFVGAAPRRPLHHGVPLQALYGEGGHHTRPPATLGSRPRQWPPQRHTELFTSHHSIYACICLSVYLS